VAADVRLTVFNLLGQEMAVLASGAMNACVHVVSFDAAELPAGVYFYRLDAGSFTDVKKMMLLK
ncbi:MAG: T9SS type A sorting domain-containing protein, partial [bacterium]|nr:T9SS type A sorting domain-containing protein [bacterium]